MDFKGFILHEGRHTEKDKYYLSHIWNLKTSSYRGQLVVARGGGGGWRKWVNTVDP